MRNTVRYHLRALVRPLKRRVHRGTSGPNRKASTCTLCHSHNTKYDLLPNDDNLIEETFELLPPARIPDTISLVRPSTAPSPSAATAGHSFAAATASTSTLDFSLGPPTPGAPGSTASVSDASTDGRVARRRRRDTLAKSLALDSWLFVDGESEIEQMNKNPDAVPRDHLKTRRDSFMWMRFDGHGGGLAWSDVSRLSGAMVM